MYFKGSGQSSCTTAKVAAKRPAKMMVFTVVTISEAIRIRALGFMLGWLIELRISVEVLFLCFCLVCDLIL